MNNTLRQQVQMYSRMAVDQALEYAAAAQSRNFAFTDQVAEVFCIRRTSWPPSQNYDVTSKI